MRTTFKHLKSLPVETASGTPVGRVTDLVLELDGQLVAQYAVKPSRLSSKELFISRDQILRFEEQKIIVSDTTMPITNTARAKFGTVAPEAISMRTE